MELDELRFVSVFSQIDSPVASQYQPKTLDWGEILEIQRN